MGTIISIDAATLNGLGLWEATLPGVNPARQRRSRKTVANLIAAGHEMLNTRSLDALSIDDLCESAACTIGAFYSRFESKEAYFAAVQFVICQERDASLAKLVAAAERDAWPLAQICAALVSDLVAWYRSNHGVLRASLQHARHGENAWSSIKQLGVRHKAIWVALLGRRLAKKLSSREKRQRILFAHQVINGTLVHILLNDPGPVKLSDKAASERLILILVSYLSAEST
jgi:AcrR family transcriptional regulator